jgi:GxxExxY protein
VVNKEAMIIYKEESYKIVGAAFKVYNTLGHGFLEAVYQEALEIEFQKQGIPYEREKELKIVYDGVELKQTYKADFVCFGKIILELKAVSALDNAHRSQVYNYLHVTGYKLGLLLNFGNAEELEKERIVL